MNPEPKRPASTQEQEIVIAALLRAPVRAFASDLISHVKQLQVVAHCECGCGSIHFESAVTGERSTLVAHSLASTPAGGLLGVIVWGIPSQITGLEIYDMGAGDEDKNLPVPSSLTPWEARRMC